MTELTGIQIDLMVGTYSCRGENAVFMPKYKRGWDITRTTAWRTTTIDGDERKQLRGLLKKMIDTINADIEAEIGVQA
jgi:hypothetical protein